MKAESIDGKKLVPYKSVSGCWVTHTHTCTRTVSAVVAQRPSDVGDEVVVVVVFLGSTAIQPSGSRIEVTQKRFIFYVYMLKLQNQY